MKKVITYGSFDLFHEGHYKLLERAKKLGDYLIVGVTTEHYDESRGKMNVINSLMERIENVKNTGFADEIIIEDHVGQKIEDIIKYDVDVFTVGSDWIGTFDYLKDYCEVVYLERTKGISSSQLRSNYKILKLGIIGTGRIANRFVPEVRYVSGVNVESVYNPNIDEAQKFAKRFQLKLYTDDLDEFCNSVDAVYIASPHGTHYDYIKFALNHKKNVICENPMILKKSQAEELFALAEKNGCILMEALKTAFCPGFAKVLNIARSGVIGKIYDVEACFTRLAKVNSRELTDSDFGGSFTEVGSYTLLPIIKLFGSEYTDVRFDGFNAKNGLDIYTKAYIRYPDSMATAKTGLGVKSEGQLIISGTNGYIIVDAPWWKTTSFEVRYENTRMNEKYFSKFLGDGLRYEISNFVSAVNGNKHKLERLTAKDSIVLAEFMERFLNENRWRDEQ